MDREETTEAGTLNQIERLVTAGIVDDVPISTTPLVDPFGDGSPKGHLGLPIGGEEAYRLGGSLVGRYRLLPRAALDAGIGLPHAAMGAASVELLYDVGFGIRVNF